MRKILGFALMAVFLLTSCAEVQNGFKGVVYKPYAGGLDPTDIHGEGVDMGFSWLWNDMITYDCRQKTTNIETTLLDVNGMDVQITASVFHRVIPNEIGYLHLQKGEDYEETYIVPVFEGVLKDVVGDYQAQSLVTDQRTDAQRRIKEALTTAFKKNHIICDDIIIRDVDLPDNITRAIEAKQVQDEKNLLAEKKKREEENLAQARIAKAKGNYEAAQYQAKTKQILSQPRMLELYRAETDRIWAEKGVSRYGNNNVFGSGASVLLNKK